MTVFAWGQEMVWCWNLRGKYGVLWNVVRYPLIYLHELEEHVITAQRHLHDSLYRLRLTYFLDFEMIYKHPACDSSRE